MKTETMLRSTLLCGVSVLFGLLVGYFLPGRAAPPQVGETGSVVGEAQQGSEVRHTIDYNRLAHVCLQAASTSASSASKTTPGRAWSGSGFQSASPAEQSASRERAEEIINRAFDSGIWSRVAGFQVRPLLRGLAEEDSRQMQDRIREGFKRGELRLQSGAWWPED